MANEVQAHTQAHNLHTARTWTSIPSQKKERKKKTSKMQHHNFKAEKIPSMQTAGCRVVQQAGRRRGRLKQTFISCQDSGKMFTGLDMLLDIDVCSCLTSA